MGVWRVDIRPQRSECLYFSSCVLRGLGYLNLIAEYASASYISTVVKWSGSGHVHHTHGEAFRGAE